MNSVHITVDPFRVMNYFAFEKGTLQFSELANYVHRDFLSWAGTICETLEREINDDFSIAVTAAEYDRMLLREICRDSEFCREIRDLDFPIPLNGKERVKTAERLLRIYAPAYRFQPKKLTVHYQDAHLKVLSSWLEETAPEDAFIIVASEESYAAPFLQDGKQHMIVLPQKTESKVILQNQTAIWYTSERVALVNAAAERYVLLPELVRVSEYLGSILQQMDENDRISAQTLSEINPTVTVADIPRIEAGSQTIVSYAVIPPTASKPDIRISARSAGIVTLQGDMLKAVAPGTTELEFYIGDDPVPFEVKKVEVFKNYWIEKISLECAADQMGIGYQQTLGYAVEPSDAEDLSSLSWQSDHPDVATVTAAGEVMAVGAGTVHITLRSTQTTAGVTITVLPQIRQIQLDRHDLSFKIGETTPIYMTKSPDRVYNADVEWICSDQKIVHIEDAPDGTKVLRAMGIGSCYITCRALEGNAADTCQIHVGSKIAGQKSSKKGSEMFVTLLVIAICIFILYFIFIH